VADVVPLIRPRYETAATLAEERRIAATLATHWRCRLEKLPVAYNLDYAAVREGRVAAWIEIKRRYRDLHAHRCVFLSLQKVGAAQHCFAASRKPAFFVVQFDDCLAYAPILGPRPIEFRGRADRGDWQDREAVAVIDPSEFRLIEPA
jgi:hypothetical protein